MAKNNDLLIWNVKSVNETIFGVYQCLENGATGINVKNEVLGEMKSILNDLNDIKNIIETSSEFNNLYVKNFYVKKNHLGSVNYKHPFDINDEIQNVNDFIESFIKSNSNGENWWDLFEFHMLDTMELLNDLATYGYTTHPQYYFSAA